MIAPVVLIAFFVGLLVEASVMFWLDRAAIRREQAFWEDLRASALDNYGRVFDWERD